MVAGCGDDITFEGPDDGIDPEDFTTDGSATTRLIPEICGTRQWTTVKASTDEVDLAVVPMSPALGHVAGAAVFSVAKSGGSLRAFLVDARGLIMGDPAGTVINGEAAYTGVSAGIADGRLVTALSNGTDKVSITIVRDDLGDFREVGNVDGSVVGDLPVMHTRGTRITATSGTAG
jgi:hypothetical protein